VIPQSGVTTASGRLSIDVRRFPWIRRLAADYAFDYARVAEFYAGDPADPDAWRSVIERVQQQPRRRAEIADALHAQQRRRGAPPESMAAADRLRDPRTVAVVTGQQAGLFGGPLFTLLKALTAIRLAERVTADFHVPAVPIFWIEGEDHDWDEVKSCAVLDEELNRRAITIGDPPGAHQGAVARVRLDDSISQALAELEATLRTTDFTTTLLTTLRSAYCVGAGMADAFGQCLESVLGPRGLVVYDASDQATKPLVADVFVREVEHAGETSRMASAAGARLQERGYHAQATPHEGSVALFQLNAGREAIDVDGDGFAVGDKHESRADLVARIRRSPEQFSPNVLLRPLVQDTLFPTVCYVAGPNELAYLGQLGDVYRAFDIPMPLMYQRATATIVDSNAMRFLTRHDLPFEALRAQD
jgi:bacillithiol biosynthesis cysteine-adding enzyme BshC